MVQQYQRAKDAASVVFQGFYNLPSDEALGYPHFSSFQDRESFIKRNIIHSPEFIQGLEKLVANDTEIVSALESGRADHDNDDTLDGHVREGNAQLFFPRVLQLINQNLKLSEIVFVGNSTGLFFPQRGDLIVHPPGKNKAFCEKGYLASYKSRHTHRFEHGELAVRVGQYQEEGPSSLVHKPYSNLELHQYKMDGKWKYLGSQVAMANTEIPIDTSPGKYLKVGAQISRIHTFDPLVPRRGDIIIKREAWDENFFHQENFRRSMIKWHRDRKIQWNADDLLIRLFVDKEKPPPQSSALHTTPEPGDHSSCIMHDECKISHPPPSSGFAELYGYARGGAVGWVYWGRAKLLFDIPVKNSPEHRDPHLLYCVTDDGQFSDFDLDEDDLQAP